MLSLVGASPEPSQSGLVSLSRLRRGPSSAWLLGMVLLGGGCGPQQRGRVVCAEGNAGPTVVASAAPLPAVSSAATAPAVAEGEVETAPPLIEGFDCFAVENEGKTGCEVVSQAADLALVPPGSQGFRRWAGGGPGGSVWNPFHVACRARLRAHCATAAVTLRIANRVLTVLPLSHAGSPQLCEFNLSSDDLDHSADRPTAVTFEPPYSTVVFRLEVGQSCGEPPEYAADRDAFVGGFAFGE